MEASSERLQAVRDRFLQEGVNVAQWARDHDFSPAIVYAVLQGRLRARRGKAHEIAVALGLKLPSSKGYASKGAPIMK